MAIAGAVLLLTLSGASMGAGFALTGQEGSVVTRFAGAGLAVVPAVLVLIGFVVAAFGLMPRWAAGLAWGALVVCLLFGQLGELLKLPQLLLDLSPFTHVPAVPAVPVAYAPVAALTGVAAGLLLIGALAFRRRDLALS